MKNARRMWSLIACMLAFCMLLASCVLDKPKPAEKSVAPKITLKFISNWGGSSPYADIVEQTIDTFNKQNPNIEIVNDSVSDEDYINKLKTNFTSGNIPDIFCLWPGPEMDRLVSSGQAADITEAVKSIEDRFSPEGMKESSYGNRYFGVPFESAFVALYINKSLLSDYGIPVPETYEQLKKAVEVLKANNVIPIAYSGHYEGSLLYQAIVAALDEKAPFVASKGNYELNKRYVDAMRVLKELYDLGAFPDKAFTLNGHEENKLFLSGKAAMIVQGSWFSGYLDEMDNDVVMSYFPCPKETEEPNKLIVNSGYGSLHISSLAIMDNERKQACVDFLRYFTSKEVVQRFVNEKGMISAVKLDDEIYASNPFAQSGLELIRHAETTPRFPSEVFGDSIWAENFIKRFPYMLENRTSPEQLYEQALNMIDRKW
ncbi:MAG: extracellular solute-binding protein [Clostridia bacterium]|nr:extracellular solute-binding protein [Clostridia bacterium]